MTKKRKNDQLVAQTSRDNATKRHFDLLNEDIVTARAKKFKLSQFQSIEDVLIQAQLTSEDVIAVAGVLRAQHIVTPFAMCQLTMELMVGFLKLPIGCALSIAAVFKQTDSLA